MIGIINLVRLQDLSLMGVWRNRRYAGDLKSPELILVWVQVPSFPPLLIISLMQIILLLQKLDYLFHRFYRIDYSQWLNLKLISSMQKVQILQFAELVILWIRYSRWLDKLIVDDAVWFLLLQIKSLCET